MEEAIVYYKDLIRRTIISHDKYPHQLDDIDLVYLEQGIYDELVSWGFKTGQDFKQIYTMCFQVVCRELELSFVEKEQKVNK